MHIKLLKEKQRIKNRQVTDFYTPRGLHIYFKDQMINDEIDVENVVSKVEGVLPHHLTSEVEMIIIGQFDEFEENGFNAFYESGTIYITNIQSDEQDMIDDLVHEFAHSVEEPYGMDIYGDYKIRNEFMEKRNMLHSILWKSGFKIPKSLFNNIDYDKDLDDILYKKIGYEKLQNMCKGLFLNSYSPTSLREYFATGFTDFFLRPDEHQYLQKLSPQLYKKILQIYSE